jgi:ankyrin repeat protein
VYNKIFGTLLILIGFGILLSVVDVLMNRTWATGKIAFVVVVQLLISLIPIIYGIKIFKNSLFSKKKSIIGISIISLISAIAIFANNEDLRRKYWNYHIQATAMKRQAQTPEIIKATKWGDIEKIKHLLAEGADINEKDSYGANALLYAHSFDLLKFLVENGCEVNVVDKNSITILNTKTSGHYHFSYESTEYLFENGLNPKIINIQNGLKNTALHLGDICLFCDGIYTRCYENGPKNINLLINFGANVNAKNFEGETPIFTVCDDSKKILLDEGADITIINNKNENLLFKVNDLELFKRLVNAGLEKALINTKGETVLHQLYNEQIINVVITDVDINHRDNKGRTALFYLRENPKKAEALLSHKADVNIADNSGNTALHIYVMGCSVGKCTNSVKGIKLLLETEININHKNDEGNTALDYARNDEMRKLLIESGAKRSSETF